jgi:hypothetical protein
MTSAIGKRKAFPGLFDHADAVYTDKKVYRDNSSFVETFINKNALLFTRPPQLGKTTLLSLADMLLNDTKQAPRGIAYTPPEGVRNAWYVLRIDFGGIASGAKATWEVMAEHMDKGVNMQIQYCINLFLDQDRHAGIKKIFYAKISPGKTMNDYSAGDLLNILAQSIATFNDGAPKPTLLVLVDEYDKPIRDVLFGLIGSKTRTFRTTLQEKYHHYVNFFDNCKSLRSMEVNIKTWVTGITPVGLSLITGFKYEDLTFKESMADAVGLLDADVDGMLDAVHQQAPFQNLQEKAAVRKAIQQHYNHLRFPFGSPLYHTGVMNQVMTTLQDAPKKRELWLGDLSKPFGGINAEAVPGSVFDLIKRAKTGDLRRVVNQLVADSDVTGLELNEGMSLTSLLESQEITTGDYLTLFVHLGVVSVSRSVNGTVFKSTSRLYRERHLRSLNDAIASSIVDLVELKTKVEIYKQGETILMDFLKSLSVSRMSSLIAWAASSPGQNRILELQLQGDMIAELHDLFVVAALDQQAEITQEDALDSGRCDVTISTERCRVVLELKKKEGNHPPTATEWTKHHNQLAGYVEDRRKENANTFVAGFVLVMYNGGEGFAVQKLRGDA